MTWPITYKSWHNFWIVHKKKSKDAGFSQNYKSTFFAFDMPPWWFAIAHEPRKVSTLCPILLRNSCFHLSCKQTFLQQFQKLWDIFPMHFSNHVAHRAIFKSIQKFSSECNHNQTNQYATCTRNSGRFGSVATKNRNHVKVKTTLRRYSKLMSPREWAILLRRFGRCCRLII